jgi:hypothetical protein
VLSDGGVPSAANGNLLGFDPLFVNPTGGDFHLKSGSPAIDAGTSAFGLAPADIDGQSRVKGKIDIGVYEDHSSADATPSNASDDPASVPR